MIDTHDLTNLDDSTLEHLFKCNIAIVEARTAILKMITAEQERRNNSKE